jgi:predicted DNA-binding protein
MAVQISAYVSDATKENLEEYSSMYGVKKGYLVENAINHYLQALYEIPDTFIVSTKIDIDEASYEKVIALVENPPQPTKALRALMHED